jgi:hypothetical protein
MTPEEAAVINEAIKAHAIGREPTGPQQSALRRAVHQLIFACNDCNHDMHRCPGCGTSVSHAGSGVCAGCSGETNALPSWVPPTESRFMAMMREELKDTVAPLPELPMLQWVTRMWRDVCTGDKVRMPGTDVTAVIEMRYRHAGFNPNTLKATPQSQDAAGRSWHVVSSGDGKFAHTRDHIVQPGECVVLLAGETAVRFMDPAKPVEIELTAEDVRAAELLGWENRL